MSEVESFDPKHPDLGSFIAIPEPYWFRPWWALFRYRPGCWECRTVYRTRSQCDTHYLTTHHTLGSTCDE